MADNCRNRIITQETRNKISKIHKGKTISEETKQKVSAVHKGKKLSEELIAAISIRSKKFNEEKGSIERMAIINTKNSWVQKTKDGEIVRIYERKCHVEEYGFKPNSMVAVSNKNITYKGFYWERIPYIGNKEHEFKLLDNKTMLMNNEKS